MRRWAVALLSLAILAAPLAVEAKPAAGAHRIGYLSPAFPPTAANPVATSVGGERCRSPRRHLIALVAAVLAGGPAFAQTAPTLPRDQAAIVEAVQKAAVRAVNFTQGDLASLRGAQPGFTPEGWRAFLKGLEGCVDDQGAPQFSSEFIPSGPPVILSQGNGALHLSIPGTLTHRQNTSSTTYRTAALDVDARGTPLKIDRLEQRTCVGLPSGVACR